MDFVALSGIQIRPFRESDRSSLERFFDDFQDELTAMDDLRRLRRERGFGAAATERCLRDMATPYGAAFIAELGGEAVGFAAGHVGEPTQEDLLSAHVGRFGVVAELYVVASARRRGVARSLVAALEQHFVEAGCETIRTEVFAPNLAARHLYERLGFVERDISLLKRIGEVGPGR